MLALKGNQPEPHAAVVHFFQDGLQRDFAVAVDKAETLDKGHGRIERLRRVALSLLKQDITTKTGIKAKRKRAGWGDAYLLHVLTHELRLRWNRGVQIFTILMKCLRMKPSMR